MTNILHHIEDEQWMLEAYRAIAGAGSHPCDYCGDPAFDGATICDRCFFDDDFEDDPETLEGLR